MKTYDIKLGPPQIVGVSEIIHFDGEKDADIFCWFGPHTVGTTQLQHFLMVNSKIDAVIKLVDEYTDIELSDEIKTYVKMSDDCSVLPAFRMMFK